MRVSNDQFVYVAGDHPLKLLITHVALRRKETVLNVYSSHVITLVASMQQVSVRLVILIVITVNVLNLIHLLKATLVFILKDLLLRPHLFPWATESYQVVCNLLTCLE